VQQSLAARGRFEVVRVRRPQSYCPIFYIDYRFSVFHDRLKIEGSEVEAGEIIAGVLAPRLLVL
jgi:hypothetical protein